VGLWVQIEDNMAVLKRTLSKKPLKETSQS